jgi:hypothetical protein
VENPPELLIFDRDLIARNEEGCGTWKSLIGDGKEAQEEGRELRNVDLK